MDNCLPFKRGERDTLPNKIGVRHQPPTPIPSEHQGPSHILFCPLPILTSSSRLFRVFPPRKAPSPCRQRQGRQRGSQGKHPKGTRSGACWVWQGWGLSGWADRACGDLIVCLTFLCPPKVTLRAHQALFSVSMTTVGNTLILQMRKLRHRQVHDLSTATGLEAWRSQELHPSLPPRSIQYRPLPGGASRLLTSVSPLQDPLTFFLFPFHAALKKPSPC